MLERLDEHVHSIFSTVALSALHLHIQLHGSPINMHMAVYMYVAVCHAYYTACTVCQLLQVHG